MPTSRKNAYSKLSTYELKSLVDSPFPDEALQAKEELAYRAAKKQQALALVPQQVKDYCEGFGIKYQGRYQEYKVFSVYIESDYDCPCYTGFPSYVLWSQKQSDSIRQVSDINLEITSYFAQKRIERNQKRRAQRKAKLAAARATKVEA